MPYKSDAQRKFFHYAESKGDISPKTVKEYDDSSKGMNLPEKVKFSNLKKKLKKEK